MEDKGREVKPMRSGAGITGFEVCRHCDLKTTNARLQAELKRTEEIRDKLGNDLIHTSVQLEHYTTAEAEGRLVVLPCKVGDTIDKLFSHNSVIALWYDKPEDRDGLYLLWRGMAWELSEEYKDLHLIKIIGIVPEKISEADTINLRVTAPNGRESEKNHED